jgi:hypothetical protein
MDPTCLIGIYFDGKIFSYKIFANEMVTFTLYFIFMDYLYQKKKSVIQIFLHNISPCTANHFLKFILLVGTICIPLKKFNMSFFILFYFYYVRSFISRFRKVNISKMIRALVHVLL